MHTSREGGLVKEGKMPMQELDSQRGEGGFFQRGLIFGEDTVLILCINIIL